MEIQILGSRGIPAQHGGFETFAENFALYLVEKGWSVIVYCQIQGDGPIHEDEWCGVQRVNIPVVAEGAKGTVIFDWRSTCYAAAKKIPILTLGYNTAIFCVTYRLLGIKNIINMDGVEWRRPKWSALERTWLYCNEKMGAWLANHLIADHPEIKNHLSNFVSAKKITVIPYSADILDSTDITLMDRFGLKGRHFALVIARPEPENLILEIVRAFSRKKRHAFLVVLGHYTLATNDYHKKVLNAASEEVKFVGAIYDKRTVNSLRYHCRLYVHGHTVGGTNPSLVEALGAKSAVLAHDNKFNRWVAGETGQYFRDADDCAHKLDFLMENDSIIANMKAGSYQQMINNFTWDKIHRSYEKLLIKEGY